MVTTIQVQEKTKHKLEELKSHPRETYNEVIERLIEARDGGEEVLSPQTIKNIESALEDIKKGRIYSTGYMKRRLGLR
jgi:predicted CopG family antitoxin